MCQNKSQNGEAEQIFKQSTVDSITREAASKLQNPEVAFVSIRFPVNEEFAEANKRIKHLCTFEVNRELDAGTPIFSELADQHLKFYRGDRIHDLDKDLDELTKFPESLVYLMEKGVITNDG